MRRFATRKVSPVAQGEQPGPASLALGTLVNHNWYWFTAFVGANLLQSGFTKRCLMEGILRKPGVGKV